MAFEVAVAQYGHERLGGARHWAILVVHDPSADGAYAFQLTGSTTTYEVKPAELVTISRAQSYLSRVSVGTITPEQLKLFDQVLRAVPVIRGDLSWHCQHWVVAVLAALHANSLHVVLRTREQLAQLLEASQSQAQTKSSLVTNAGALRSVLTRIARTQ